MLSNKEIVEMGFKEIDATLWNIIVMQVYPFVYRISNVKSSINLLRGVNNLLLIIHCNRIPIIFNWMLMIYEQLKES